MKGSLTFSEAFNRPEPAYEKPELGSRRAGPALKCLGLEPASKGSLGSLGQPVSSRRDGDGFIEQRGVCSSARS